MRHRFLSYGESHLKHGMDLFPDTPDLLLYAGVLHEKYASPKSQNALPPPGMKYRFGSRKQELLSAEKLLRKALVAEPSSAENRLRFGRVAGLLGNHEAAAVELKKAATLSTDTQLRYYAYLFLGNELAALKRNTEARDYFEQAATLYPSAPSPLLAASQLARSRGDSESARNTIQRVFALSDQKQQPYDPWWDYDIALAGNADDLVAKIQMQLGGLPQ
jgi:tetratricopeptide (TPR) repeat protein